jgi:hypothetical protein
MLIAKGYKVTVVLESGRHVTAPAAYALLHDPAGRDWPRCSALVAPFRKGGGEIRNREAESYFGSRPREGSVSVPPRALSVWRRVGAAVQILYSRRRPGNLPAAHKADYEHPFKEGKATLYRRGRELRIELGRGCVWNWRGFVTP